MSDCDEARSLRLECCDAHSMSELGYSRRIDDGRDESGSPPIASDWRAAIGPADPLNLIIEQHRNFSSSTTGGPQPDGQRCERISSTGDFVTKPAEAANIHMKCHQARMEGPRASVR